MNCPICREEMKIQRKDVSNNLKKGEGYLEYKRIVYRRKKEMSGYLQKFLSNFRSNRLVFYFLLLNHRWEMFCSKLAGLAINIASDNRGV